MSSFLLIILFLGSVVESQITCSHGPHEPCIVDCAERRTKGETLCAGSTINAEIFDGLDVICNDGDKGCLNTTITCPDFANHGERSCRIDCFGDNGCSNLKVTNFVTHHIELNCFNDNNVCSDINIGNTNSPNPELFSILCDGRNNANATTICNNINVKIGPTPLHINCVNNASCNNMIINSVNLPNLQLNVRDHSSLTQSSFNVNDSHNISVILSNDSILNNVNISAENADEVYVSVDKLSSIYNYSVIDARYSNNFNIICHGYCGQKNNDFSMYVPPAQYINKTISKYHSSLTCIDHGCKSLNLYTINGANDINLTARDCPCNQDILTACIDEWNIFCGNKYTEKGSLISATECTGNSTCCGDVVTNIHEDYCPFPSNASYYCKPNEPCIINCNNVNNTDNIFNVNFSCNTQHSIIYGGNATYLQVICNKLQCYNLSVTCPSTNCNVTCTDDNSCKYLSISTQNSNSVVLNCIGTNNPKNSDICLYAQISDDTTGLIGNKSLAINCNQARCSNITVSANRAKYDLFNLHCNGDCDNLYFNMPLVSISMINTSTTGTISNSIFMLNNADTVNITNKAVLNGLHVDCTDCTALHIQNTGNQNQFTNSTVLGSSIKDNFYLYCFSETNQTMHGCDNIDLYIPSDKYKTLIECDKYGCNSFNIYTQHAITDDATFTTSNCPCSVDLHTECINKWDIYCGNDGHSIFQNAQCQNDNKNNDCCGDIVNAMHEPNCSPFICASGEDCVIDCNDSEFIEFPCFNETIYAQNASSLHLICDDNINCDDIQIECPFHSKCIIDCNGTNNNCNNIQINTDRMQYLELNCYGNSCSNININDKMDINTPNMMSITSDSDIIVNCFGACNDFVFDINSNYYKTLNINCEETCDTMMINAPYLSKLSINQYGTSTAFQNSIINATNVNTISINASLFTENKMYFENAHSFNLNAISMNSIGDNELHGESAENVLIVINKDVSFHDNTLFMDNAQDVMILNQGIYNSNKMYANNIKNVFNMSCSGSGSFTNNEIDGNNATKMYFRFTYNTSNNIFNMNMAQNVQIINSGSNIINANKAKSVYISCKQQCSPNLQLKETQNATLDINTQFIDGMNINAQNAKSLTMNIGKSIQIDNSIAIHMNIHSVQNFYLNVNGSLIGYKLNLSKSHNAIMKCDENCIIQSNEFYVSNVTMFNVILLNNANITSNIFYGNFTKNMLFNINHKTSTFVSNDLFVENAGSVSIINHGIYDFNNVYGNKLDTFKLSCIGSFSRCNSNDTQSKYYLNNASNAIFSIDTDDINYNGLIHFNINATFIKMINIYYGSNINANHPSLNLYAQYADQVTVDFEGAIFNSTINGEHANLVKVICNGKKSNITDYGCNSLNLLFPPKEVKEKSVKSSLICKQYGCNVLNITTINGMNDTNVTGIDCPCKDDIITACIKQWNIYCNKGKSIFNGAKNCSGDCCGDVIDMIHIGQCKWHNSGKHSSGLSLIAIILIIVGAVVILAIICGIIWYKRKTRVQQLKLDAPYY